MEIQIISRLNLADKAILTTGHYNDRKVISGCCFCNIKMIPKIYVEHVNLRKI